MHPLTTDLGEQILALIKVQSYSLLGAIQDNKTVLGGSGGSGGGVGDPPAGFVGQLTQSNVTFDTGGATRACSAGSAGSSSLVDNLDAIRLGIEICDNAIGDRHIDWGHGAGQVDAEDVPFTSGSFVATNVHDALEELVGMGGITTIGQVVSVGASGCNYTLVSDAIAYINGLGDAAANKPYLIWVMAGEFAETASVTIPQYVHVHGKGEATTLDMDDYRVIVSADGSLESMVVTSTGADADRVVDFAGNNAVGRDLRIIATGASGCVDVGSATGVELYHVICEATTPSSWGFYIYDSTVQLWDCEADDTTNFVFALQLGTTGNPSTATTKFCEFRAASAGNDVNVLANNTWNHFETQFDPDNCTLTGTETPLPHGRSYFKGGLRTRVVSDDVSDPPTDAELDTAFGQPATLGEGFMGIVDDNNAQTKMWLAVTGGSTWWYEELTKAV